MGIRVVYRGFLMNLPSKPSLFVSGSVGTLQNEYLTDPKLFNWTMLPVLL